MKKMHQNECLYFQFLFFFSLTISLFTFIFDISAKVSFSSIKSLTLKADFFNFFREILLTMKKLILLIMFCNLVFGKDNHIKSMKIINNTFKDMETFCKGKEIENFCSTEHLELVAGSLHRQLEVIKIKMEHEKLEARKAAILSRKQKLNRERMELMLREHFLDRHI
jgi:hypothetical protein